MPASRIAFDWRSIGRWCLLATIVMLLWLLAPVAKCSWGAFRDTPLPQAMPHETSSPTPAPAPAPDAEEPVAEEPGFFSQLGTAVGGCYRRTPLFGQEDWKGHLLVLFAALTVIARGLYYLEQRRKRTFDS